MPPTRTVISGTVSVSIFARSTSMSAGEVSDPCGNSCGNRPPPVEARRTKHIGLILRRIYAARREGHLHVVAGILCGLFDRGVAAENDQVGERNLLAARLRLLNSFWMLSRRGNTLASSAGLLTSQSFCGARRSARPIGAATHVGATERSRRGPSRPHQFGNRQARRRDLGLQRRDVLRVNRFVIGLGQRILPNQVFLWNLRTDIASLAGPCRDGSA